jgi:hypothetical protein
MGNRTTIEDLIITARNGNKQAEEEFFSKLTVRFLSVITREIRNYSSLTKRINVAEESDAICDFAISEVRRLFPINHPKFSIMWAVNVLHNVVDNFVTNLLVDIAKDGDPEAEDQLFSLIRKKLLERINRKRWREGQDE